MQHAHETSEPLGALDGMTYAHGGIHELVAHVAVVAEDQQTGLLHILERRHVVVAGGRVEQ